MQNNNQEAYVALSLDKKTLTFYYDEQRKSRPEKTWGIDEKIIEDEVEFCAWTGTGDVPNTTITAAEFDASFKNFCPTTTANWFYQLMRLKTIRGWRYLNTSKVEDLNSMFAGCSSLTTLNLSGFDTSKVVNMKAMFSVCTALTTLDLSHFNTSKVDNMSNLFHMCPSLTSLDLTNFDTSKVKMMSNMFTSCESLTTIYCNSTWDNECSRDMFAGCTSLRGAVPYDESKTDASMANPETGYFSRR